MQEIIEKKKCTGCTTCMNICPKNAISFSENNEGFKYPVINQEKCIDCGLCQKKCPVLNTTKNESSNKCYVGYCKDENELKNASSGSIFSMIANEILDNNGIVVGAAFDKNNHLKHIAIEKNEDLNPLRKSKYLQSDLENIFKSIKEQLKTRKVLFVGTPCQVAGIKSYIKNDESLITIDLFCHGVPSPKLFAKYVRELESQEVDSVTSYDFRDKTTGWDTYSNKIVFKTKEKKMDRAKNEYMQLFLADVALRESCYECNFKLGNKYSDITLGDFWGVKNYYPEMYNKEGVSAIIINTDKGKEIFHNIDNLLEYKECTLESIIKGNSSLIKSANRPKVRDTFFDELENNSIKDLAKKYKKKTSMVIKIKSYLKKLINKRKKVSI